MKLFFDPILDNLVKFIQPVGYSQLHFASQLILDLNNVSSITEEQRTIRGSLVEYSALVNYFVREELLLFIYLNRTHFLLENLSGRRSYKAWFN